MKEFSREELLRHISDLNEIDFGRFVYASRLGNVYTTIAIFEHTLAQLLLMPSRVRFPDHDAQLTNLDRFLSKREALAASTLGNLIKLLKKHGGTEADVSYLNFVKGKRDYFIHRFFADWPWPGDLMPHMLHPMIRKLTYLELIFGRATDRLPAVLGRSGLVEMVDLGSDGHLLINDWPLD